MNPSEQPTPQCGWRIAQWCEATGISDQMVYILWREERGPYRTKVGRRLTIIRESPSDYLQRMALEPPPPVRPAKAPARPGSVKSPLWRLDPAHVRP